MVTPPRGENRKTDLEMERTATMQSKRKAHLRIRSNMQVRLKLCVIAVCDGFHRDNIIREIMLEDISFICGFLRDHEPCRVRYVLFGTE